MTQRAEHDFIIVGSGAGGGPLAANLAKAGHRVLLLEAGSDKANLNYSVPVYNAQATEDPTYRWDYYVRHYADQQQQVLRCVEVLGVRYPALNIVGLWVDESGIVQRLGAE